MSYICFSGGERGSLGSYRLPSSEEISSVRMGRQL